MLKLFDTIANLNPIPAERLTLLEPEYQGIQTLPIGQVDTIVEIYNTETLNIWLSLQICRGASMQWRF
jgi:hypothetical protein